METPVNAPVGEKFRIEIKKLKSMTFGEKLGYIWEYYKPFLLIFTLSIIFIVWFINFRFINPPPKTILYISWNAKFVTTEQIADLNDELNKKLIDEDKNEEVVIAQSLIPEDDITLLHISNTRIVAMITAGHLDILINDSMIFEAHTESSFLVPMDDTFFSKIKTLNPLMYEEIIENAVNAPFYIDENTTVEKILGINIGKSPLLTSLGFFEQDYYFSIALNTSNEMEMIVKALLAFYE